MAKDKELQRKFVEFQILKGQFEAGIENKTQIEQKLAEIIQTSEALEELKRVKKNGSMLAPFGAGAFVKASLEDTENVVIAIGSDVFAKKSVDEAQRILEEKQKEIFKIYEELANQLIALQHRLQELESELESLSSEKKNEDSVAE